MSSSEFVPYIELAITIFGFAVVLGYYKATFLHHEKILDRHEHAINAMITRLDVMNAESSFIKGFITGKQV
jgi:hypothetical protein